MAKTYTVTKSSLPPSNQMSKAPAGTGLYTPAPAGTGVYTPSGSGGSSSGRSGGGYTSPQEPNFTTESGEEIYVAPPKPVTQSQMLQKSLMKNNNLSEVALSGKYVQNKTNLPSPPTANPSALVQATAGEKVRGFIRQKTGVSLPSIKQTFNTLTGREEYEKVTPYDVLLSPLSVTSSAIKEPVAGAVTSISEMIGLPTLKRTIVKADPNSPHPIEQYTIEETYLSPSGVGAVAGLAAETAFFGFANPKTATSIIKKTINPQIGSKEKSLSDAIKIGNTPEGGEIFKVKGKAITNIVDKNNNPLNLIKTESESIMIITKDELGNLIATGRTVAASTGKGQTRKYLKENQLLKDAEDKLTQKLSLVEAKGTMNFNKEINVLGELEGTGGAKITELGRINLVTNAKETMSFVTKNKIKPQSSALFNIKSNELAKDVNAVRTKGAVTLLGEQTFYKSKILTDTYQDLIKVKGYKNVQAYLRQPRSFATKSREAIKQRAYTEELGSSFTPREIGLDFDTAGINILKPPVTANPTQVLNVPSKSAQAAVTTAQAQLTSILKSSVEKNALKPIIKNVKVTSLSLSKTVLVNAQLPLAKSIYYGKGQYEVTESQASFAMPKSNQALINIEQPKVKTDTLTFNLPKTNQIDLLSSKQKENLLSLPTTKPRNRFGQPQPTNQREEVIQSFVFRQDQPQKQEQPQPPKLRFDNPPKPRPPRIPTPTIIKVPKLKQAGTFKSKGISDFGLKKAYDIFIRKKGKEVRIGENLPIGKATKLGVSRNLRDLSASFTLKQRGTTSQEDINYNVPTNLFRPSKKDIGRIVQRRRSRLGSGTEVSEILSAKRSKRRRVNIW